MSDVRYCPSCGAQVSADERFCGNCGTRMDPPAPAPAAPTVPLGQQGAAPTQVLPPAQPPSFGVPPVVDPQAPPPRRGLPIWAIVLIALVALCAIACAATIGFVAIFGESTSATATPRPAGQGGGIVPVPTSASDTSTEADMPAPTEELIPAPTEAAVATLAPTSTGGGIIGGVSPNSAPARTAEAATAQAAQATSEAAQASAEVAALIASGTQVFSDAFVDNRNAWFTGVFQDIETDTIEDGVFKVSWTARGTSYELYEVREIANFAAEVDCLIHQGGTDGSCGLVFDQKTDVGFYKFELFDDYYRLFIVRPEGDPEILAEGDPAGIVNAGGVNRLRVVRQGAQIWLFLNDTLLNSVSDDTYATGKIGVSTNSYNDSGGVEVWFDNFTIWELPG